MTEIKLKRRGIVYCEDCSYWDKAVIGHTQGDEDIGDRLCRRQMRWTMEMDYCSDGVVEQTGPHTERVETMSCQECKWWFTDSLKHGGYCQSLLYNHECRYEPEVDCSWK